MAFNFLAAAGLLILSTGINLLLGKVQTKRKRPDEFELTKAEEGRVQPLGYGVFPVAPNIVNWHDARQGEFSNGATAYQAKVVGTLCLGPVGAIFDIMIGDKSLRFEPVTEAQGGSGAQVITPNLPYVLTEPDVGVEFQVFARDMFGGRNREGGISGKFRLYPGGTAQIADEITTEYMQDAGLSGGTGHPGVCYFAAGEVDDPFYWGTVPTPQEWVFMLQFVPQALAELELDEDYVSGFIGQDANPVEIIYDILTNPLRGLGINTALIDIANFTAVAKQLLAENLGLSCLFDEQQEASDMIEDILKHIDGMLRPDPVTGLFTLKLARFDYNLFDRPRVTNRLHGASYGNARDIKISRSGARDTANDIIMKYRRYETGPTGDVTSETLGTYPADRENMPFGLSPHVPRWTFQTKGRNLTNLVLYSDGVELTANVHYGVVDIAQGIITVFYDGTLVAGGSIITADYTSGMTFSGYKESLARAQDLASVQSAGEIRHRSYDYPFYTNALNAGRRIARLLYIMSRTLWQAEWKMDRIGHNLASGDVVRLFYEELDENGNMITILDDVAFRILEIDYGTLEDRDISITAVEDVFAEDVEPIMPTAEPPSSTPAREAPAIMISYAATSAIKICLFATDVNFNIELQSATDSLGGGSLVLTSSLPGSTTSYTDTQTVGTILYYRARHIPTTAQLGFTAGPWTAWTVMEATSGTPGACVCTIPSVSFVTNDDGSTASVTLTITDPQGRVSLVEFQTQAGTAPESAWVEDSAAPYTAQVARVAGANSRISWRITYINCSSAEVLDLVGTQYFPLSSTTGGDLVELGDIVYEDGNPLYE